MNSHKVSLSAILLAKGELINLNSFINSLLAWCHIFHFMQWGFKKQYLPTTGWVLQNTWSPGSLGSPALAVAWNFCIHRRWILDFKWTQQGWVLTAVGILQFEMPLFEALELRLLGHVWWIHKRRKKGLLGWHISLAEAPVPCKCACIWSAFHIITPLTNTQVATIILNVYYSTGIVKLLRKHHKHAVTETNGKRKKLTSQDSKSYGCRGFAWNSPV